MNNTLMAVAFFFAFWGMALCAPIVFRPWHARIPTWQAVAAITGIILQIASVTLQTIALLRLGA